MDYFVKTEISMEEVRFFFVNQDIPCKTITTFSFPNSLEVLPLKINLRNKKIIVIAC